MLSVAKVQTPLSRERGTHARRPSGKHTIEKIHTPLDDVHEASGIADAYEVAKPAGGQERGGESHDLQHGAALLSHRQAPDGITREPDL